jgi:hypothetical protein
MCCFGLQELAMSTVEGSPVLRHALQMPSSGLTTYMALVLGSVLEVMLWLDEQEQVANQLEVTVWLVNWGDEKMFWSSGELEKRR